MAERRDHTSANDLAYDSHSWKTERQMADYGAGVEYIVVCDECGCEYHGDPAEFPELEYPMCDQMGDAC